MTPSCTGRCASTVACRTRNICKTPAALTPDLETIGKTGAHNHLQVEHRRMVWKLEGNSIWRTAVGNSGEPVPMWEQASGSEDFRLHGYHTAMCAASLYAAKACCNSVNHSEPPRMMARGSARGVREQIQGCRTSLPAGGSFRSWDRPVSSVASLLRPQELWTVRPLSRRCAGRALRQADLLCRPPELVKTATATFWK